MPPAIRSGVPAAGDDGGEDGADGVNDAGTDDADAPVPGDVTWL